jgi:hypothetical protein
VASIFKTLWERLAGDAGAAAPEPRLEPVEYKGYRIRPAPYKAAGGFQTCGVIEQDGEDGAVREHRFVRAETHPSLDDAASFAIAKAKQIIDQQGERLFK